MTHNAKIYVLAPHADDLVSVAPLAAHWVQRGYVITVITVCTGHPPALLSEYAEQKIRSWGCAASESMKIRIQEERRAAAILRLKTQQLGMRDAIFRDGDTPARWRVNVRADCFHFQDFDLGFVDLLKRKLLDLKLRGLVLTPLGVGGHVDHVAVRMAAERVFSASQLLYYGDQPYCCRAGFSEGAPADDLRRLNFSVGESAHQLAQQAAGQYVSQTSCLERDGVTLDLLARPWGDGLMPLWTRCTESKLWAGMVTSTGRLESS